MALRCRLGIHNWYVLRSQEIPASLSPGYAFTIRDRVCLRCEKRDDAIGRRERIAAERKARAKEIVRFEPTTEPAACVNRRPGA